MRKSLAVVGALAASTLALSACGSSSSSSSSSSAAPSSSTASSGVDAAKAYLAKYSQTPTSIGELTPLSKKPAAGKTVIGIANGTDSAKVLSDSWAAAAADLGWTYKFIDAGYTPESEQKALESAIALNPDGIMSSGIETTTAEAQFAEAHAKGIPINTSASTDPSSPTGYFDASIADVNQIDEWGKMIAAYVVVQTNGAAKVQDFSLPVYPILERFDTSFKAAMAEWCPTCTFNENPQQGADIGTKTPGAVVSALQKAPDTNWIIFDLGDLETGVDSALTAAGITGVKIGGLTGTKANIAAVKTGAQEAWTAYSLPIVGFRQVDSMARQLNGDPILNQELPTQVIDPANVGTLVTDTKGNYVGVADYETQFKKLWLLG